MREDEWKEEDEKLRCYGWLTVVSNVDVEGFVLNVDGRRMQELDYIGVCITEQWINTQGESASQVQECNASLSVVQLGRWNVDATSDDSAIVFRY
jgi:hypothetical protein